MQQYKNAVTAATGLAIAGATVTVTLAAGGAATLYSGNGTGVLGSNVLTTGADGTYSFYAANGRYLLTIAASGFDASTLDVILFDPDDTVAGADATGVADSTAALQAHINRYAGGLCELPEGIFRITDALVMPANTWLRGAGRGTVIKCLTLANGGTGYGHRMIDLRVAGCKISGIAFDAGSMTGFVAGMRCILAVDATGYEISSCHFITPGAAVASLNCSDYRVINNSIVVASTTGAALHDGIIDQWYGSHDFLVHGNTLQCSGIGLWPILVTGDTTAGDPAACYDFHISNNKIYDCVQAGIWVMGRSGTCYGFTVAGNLVDGVSDFFGIAVTDAQHFTVTGNVTKDTALCGVRLYSETGQGGTLAAKSGTLTGNTIINANTAGATDADSGAAISVTDASDRVAVAGNTVVGSAHRYAVHLGTATTRCEVSGFNLDAGVVGTVLNQAGTTNTVPGGATYTPTLTAVANVTTAASGVIRFDRQGNVVTGSGRLDVTPTAAGSADTQVGITIPVASNFAFTSDAGGVAGSSFGIVGSISADVTNDRLLLRFPAPNTSTNTLYFSFSYTVK